jgi:hypothetical protein
MSGGTFDYNQYRIRDIANRVEQEISKSGTPKTESELKDEGWYRDREWYEKYPEDLNHYKYPDEVIAEFKKGYEMLRKAEIYAQRMDWLFAGDDGEESFIQRLKGELLHLELELKSKTFEVKDNEDED